MLSSQRYAACVAAAAMIAATGVAAAWQAIRATAVDQPRKGAAVSIVSQMNFRYDSTFIWSTLMMTSGLESITGFTIDESDRDKPPSKIGDSFAASDAAEKGKLIVTGFDKGRELRLVFEPDSAAYVVHKRFFIATAGNGSVLQYWSQYTDFQPEVDEKATKERERIKVGVDAFRAMVESRVKPRQPTGHGH